ncbi:GNAT family N-acetyltransferase [Nostoc sp.]|uniref:GNAT family N-acetyltransferase n=1 Tax=Nostoc sp. TaxID=1180 RepID=UPI002FFADA78
MHDIWVEPEYRQNGIARQMVMVSIERFHQIGVKQIRLDTAVANEASRRLFASCGFRLSIIEMLREL